MMNDELAESTHDAMDGEVSALLGHLCAHFDAELARQEAIMAACVTQGQSARRRDIEALESATDHLSGLMREAIAGEDERFRILSPLVERLGLAAEAQTLSTLIAVSPEPWRDRMREFQIRMRSVLAETRAVVHANARYIRRAGRVTDGLMSLMTGSEPGDRAAYDQDGREPVAQRCAPALINAVG